MKKVTLEQKKEAVRIAIKGGDPVNYLRVCGSRDPGQMWAMIRAKLRKDNPEIFLKLPKPEVKQKEEAPEQYQVVKTANGMMHNINRNPPPPQQPPEQVPTVKVDGAIRIETPEAKKVEVVEAPELKMGPIPKPIKNIDVPPLKPGLRGLNNSDFTVSAIKHPQLGEFYYDQKFNSVDWRSPEGEEISLHPAMWKELYMIIPDVMGILGVPDYE